MKKSWSGRGLAPLAAAVGLGALNLASLDCGRGATRSSPLVLSVPYEIDTLDPHAKDRLSESAIDHHFYEALVSTDAEMGVHPSLALRWDNPDLLTWVFYLRPGVRFHDGRPLTASDVVYSFERLLKNPKLERGLYIVQIASVRALDPNTVEIRTHKPTAVLLSKLSNVFVVREGRTHSSRTG